MNAGRAQIAAEHIQPGEPLLCGSCRDEAKAAEVAVERDRYRDAIVDALADLTPGIAPYSVLADALEPRRKEASDG